MSQQKSALTLPLTSDNDIEIAIDQSLIEHILNEHQNFKIDTTFSAFTNFGRRLSKVFLNSWHLNKSRYLSFFGIDTYANTEHALPLDLECSMKQDANGENIYRIKLLDGNKISLGLLEGCKLLVKEGETWNTLRQMEFYTTVTRQTSFTPTKSDSTISLDGTTEVTLEDIHVKDAAGIEYPEVALPLSEFAKTVNKFVAEITDDYLNNTKVEYPALPKCWGVDGYVPKISAGVGYLQVGVDFDVIKMEVDCVLIKIAEEQKLKKFNDEDKSKCSS